MKAVILAGGQGTRLYPITVAVPKHLVPVLDKPALYYSMSLAIDLGADSFCIVTDPYYVTDTSLVVGQALVSSGMRWTIVTQPRPNGIVAAMLMAKDWIGTDPFLLLLSDNVFVGDIKVAPCTGPAQGKAQSWLVRSGTPELFGVYSHDDSHFYEKPSTYMGSWITTGLYAFPSGACSIAQSVPESQRGEYEITSLLNLYADQGKVEVSTLCTLSWHDIGTVDGLVKATQAVGAYQSSSGLLSGSPEVSLAMAGFQISPLGGTDYDRAVRSTISTLKARA